MERHSLVDRLVAECLERPPDERNRYLAEACSDPETCARVLNRLASLRHQKPANVEHGQQIGPYTVQAEVGCGGMGRVYKAHREEDQFRLTVALKILNPGDHSETVLRRFRLERQILAGFDHPYIGRLLDGGTAPNGSPYFAMEFVQGQPLHRYCDEHQLNVRERLELFRKICEAVSYAHRHLIVHRDLKPSNILITTEGTPKLLDFGIAKSLDSSTELAQETATLRMATPAYASPEQILGQFIGTGSDVYSLGVILYELLTGHSPYGVHRGDSQPLASLICEQDPTRPSAVIESLENYDVSSGAQKAVEPEDLANRRATTIIGLRKELRGELETIVATALRKEPDRRYASVELLSEDLRRYLENEPILAQRDSFGYRASKFAKRHRWGVAFGAAAMLALSITSGYAIWKAQALSDRIDADHKLSTAYLTEIHDAVANLPGSTPAREVLLRRSLQYMNGLAEQGSSDPELNRSLALAYEKFAELQGGASGSGLGQPSQAIEPAQRAQEIRLKLVATDADNRTYRYDLAKNYLLTSFLLGRTRNQLSRLEQDRKALAIAESLVKEDPVNQDFENLLAKAHVSLAYGLTFSADFANVRSHFAKALAIRERLLRKQPDNTAIRLEVAQIHYRIGSSYVDTKEFGQAIRELEAAASTQESVLAADHDNERVRSDLASSYHFLGMALNGMQKRGPALTRLNQAIAIREATVAQDPLDARSRSFLAGNYAERARVQLADSDLQAALASIQSSIGIQQELHRLDPQAIPTRLSLAQYLAELAEIHRAFATNPRRSQPQRLLSWQDAAAAYRRADDFYEQLRRQGHLRSPMIASDAESVKVGVRDCDLQVKKLRSSVAAPTASLLLSLPFSQ